MAPILYRERLESWKTESEGIPGKQGDLRDDYLGSSLYKTLFTRRNGSTPNTTIGGLCVVYSGDLNYLMKGTLPDGLKITKPQDIARWSRNLPRLDQIVDSIGPTTSDTYLCVFEDSFFASLISNQLGLSQGELAKVFRDVSERSSEIVKKWLSLSTGRSIKFVPVYTSDIDDLLQEYVVRLAGEVGNQKILRAEKSKINMMYTYLWPALLKRAGYLQDENVLCCEPFQHFLEVALPSRNGYYGIDEFLEDNPWGYGKNSRFQTAGFVPMISLDGQTFARQTPYTESVNQANAKKKLVDSVQRGFNQPFPLNQNPIVKESVNLLFPFEDSRQLIRDVAEIEKEYKNARKGKGNGLIGCIAESSRVKNKFGGKIIAPLEELSSQIEDLYSRLSFIR
ncbi:MAG: hypothetical protein HYW24_02855 [Candidatus Aenigmarchaeota archaeon]|nr:hypothetical protein [Candidatus Aenigmarchaeota archaeon]